MKVEKLDDEEEIEAEDVMDVIKAINDYLWVEAGDEGPYDGAIILGVSYNTCICINIDYRNIGIYICVKSQEVHLADFKLSLFYGQM